MAMRPQPTAVFSFSNADQFTGAEIFSFGAERAFQDIAIIDVVRVEDPADFCAEERWRFFPDGRSVYHCALKEEHAQPLPKERTPLTKERLERCAARTPNLTSLPGVKGDAPGVLTFAVVESDVLCGLVPRTRLNAFVRAYAMRAKATVRVVFVRAAPDDAFIRCKGRKRTAGIEFPYGPRKALWREPVSLPTDVFTRRTLATDPVDVDREAARLDADLDLRAVCDEMAAHKRPPCPFRAMLKRRRLAD